MKVSLFLSFVTFLMLPGMGQAGATKSSYSYQGVSASASWNSAWSDEFCLYGSASVSATEGTYTEQTDGKAIGTPVHDIYFSYWFDDRCNQTTYSGYAYGSMTGDINISFKKNNAVATVSAVLDGTSYRNSWMNGYTWKEEPFWVAFDLTWSGCTLTNSGKSVSKSSSGNIRYPYKNANKYATACTLNATVSDIGFVLDPDTAWASLYEGQNMQVTMEKKIF